MIKQGQLLQMLGIDCSSVDRRPFPRFLDSERMLRQSPKHEIFGDFGTIYVQIESEIRNITQNIKSIFRTQISHFPGK